MISQHIIKHWARTQPGVALSSGEAELYALVKASTETLGVKSLYKELGQEMEGVILTDSSAARGTVLRQGSGRLKHVELNTFWVQD